MKVYELIDMLKTFNPNTSVLTQNEDGDWEDLRIHLVSQKESAFQDKPSDTQFPFVALN